MKTTFTLASLVCAFAFVPLLQGEAQACGGLFCSQSNPVNQAAERIIFSQNDNETVTAIVQIMYEGPSEQFSWLLPVPGIPTVGVSSDIAFQRIQLLTNPQYTLRTLFEPGCSSSNGTSGSNGVVSTSNGTTGGDGGINVLASGSVGPYDYTLIEASPNADDPVEEALEWLSDNGYDISATAPELLRSYLEEGMNLIAFKLTKNNDTGDIRPVMLTYASETPMIPIRPTAVAANDDMGILVWVLSDNRAVPVNYRSLVLNEALIDWFNPSDSYNAVVTAAANESGGQGFVTEFAGNSNNAADLVFSERERIEWASILELDQQEDPSQLIARVLRNYNGWDGMEESAQALFPTLELSPLDANDLLDCFINSDNALSFECDISEQTVLFERQSNEEGFDNVDVGAYLSAVEENVVRPMSLTQELFAMQPYMTRLYTTLSASEMTVDPVFDFNPELDPVSNIHQATRYISCGDSGYAWRAELENGDEVYSQSENLVWPYQVGSQDLPANRVVRQESASGEGEVIEDNTMLIRQALSTDAPPSVDNNGTDGSGSSNGNTPGGSPTSGNPNDSPMGDVSEDEGCACTSVHSTNPNRPFGLALLVLFGFAFVVRRHRS